MRSPLAIVVLMLALGAPAHAAGEPPGFTIETVYEGAAQPTAVDFLPDGRLVVAGRAGGVDIVDPTARPVSATRVVTVPVAAPNEEIGFSELGLTGLAVDPDFARNGFIYVWHSFDAFGTQRLTRFTIVDDVAAAGSANVLWESPERASEPSYNHVGGGISFGPDGNIWFSIGDRWNWNHAQNLAISSGAVHRIAPDGSIPPDNPFNDGPGPNVDSIFSYGHRNPFRIRWDAGSETLYVAEVGYNTWEEINTVRLDAPGRNYEWPACEGFAARSEQARSDCVNTFFPSFFRSGFQKATNWRGLSVLLFASGGIGLVLWQRRRLGWVTWVVVVGVIGVGSAVVVTESMDLAERLSHNQAPLFVYQHDVVSEDPAVPDTPTGASISGGAVYRGSQFPEEYAGAYFFGDFLNGWLAYLTLDETDHPTYHPFANDIGAVVDVNASPSGDIYFVVYFDVTGGDPTTSGSIHRIIYKGEGTGT